MTLLIDAGKKIKVSCCVYLIEDPKRTILVDTGCSFDGKSSIQKKWKSYPPHLEQDDHLTAFSTRQGSEQIKST
jgi:glyoxylase-like metal-dependent hydrolase (beta-lactamase superfamily II)